MPAGGVGCSPLPCLRRLFTRDDDDGGGGDGVMMTMVMMDGPHCPWVRPLYTIMICMVLFNVHSRVGRKLYTVLGLGLGYIQFHKRLPETTSHLYTISKQLG